MDGAVWGVMRRKMIESVALRRGVLHRMPWRIGNRGVNRAVLGCVATFATGIDENATRL